MYCPGIRRIVVSVNLVAQQLCYMSPSGGSRSYRKNAPQNSGVARFGESSLPISNRTQKCMQRFRQFTKLYGLLAVVFAVARVYTAQQ
jgi:predicted lysophospholipase L1 biosynthesis ABC-type transport system permease subunit